MCHLSLLFSSSSFLDKVLELVGGGLLSTGLPSPVILVSTCRAKAKTMFHLKHIVNEFKGS